MATTEQTGLMTYVDEDGNLHILYPVTTIDAVDGLDEALEGRAPSDHKHTAEDVGAVTETQVSTMINAALGVIENGTY